MSEAREPGRRAGGSGGSCAIRRLGSALLYATYLTAFVTAVAYLGFWLPFRSELLERHSPESDRWDPPRYVDEALMRQIGSIASGRPGTFVHFEREKAPGVTRACALGDSYTYGDEVAPEQDPPALLQALARRRGHDAFEVLNFASNWHGFHQSFLIWEGLARDFGCDFVLLGPASFQPERDNQINHTQLARPYYLHARYVLDEGGELRRVEVEGATPRERFDDYFRFIPRWRYLRYDRNPPPVLLSLIPEGRTLRNPAYYDDRPAREEALPIWSAMLRRILDDGPQIVVVHRDPAIVGLVESLGDERAVAAPAFDAWQFPYRAPRGHNSAWANRVIAEQFYAHLALDPSPAVPVLQIGAAIPAASDVGDAELPALSRVDAIEVTIGDAKIGSLVTASRNFFRAGLAADFTRSASVLLVKDPRSATTDAAFVPLRFPLADGSPLSLHVEGKALALGAVRMLPGMPVGLADLEGFELEAHRELVFHGSRAVPETAFAGASRMTLFVGDAPALEGFRRANRVVFYPIRGALLQLSVDATHAADPDALPAEGTLDLVLRGAGGDRRTPFGTWRKLALPLAVANRVLPERLPPRPAVLATTGR